MKLTIVVNKDNIKAEIVFLKVFLKNESILSF